MPSDQITQDVRVKLENKVKAAGHSDKIVQVDEEQKIVSDAVEAGLSVEYAESVAGICIEKGYCRETELNHILGVVFSNQAKNDGKVDEGEFKQCIDIAGELTHKRIPEMKMRKKGKAIMQENGIQAKSSGFMSGSKWFDTI